MPIRRLHLTGASGSGTTTLGAALSARLGCPVFDADSYYWLPTTPPFQQKRDKIERNESLLRDLAAHPAWILSGSAVDWDNRIEQSFDLVVLLWIPVELRLERLRRREQERYGSIDPTFLDWAAQYDTGDLTIRSRARHEAWLQKINRPVLRLEGDLSTEERVNRVLAAITDSARED